MVFFIVLLRGFPRFHDFRMVHPIPTSPSFNDFCTCSTNFDGSRINEANCMRTCVG